MNLNKVEKFVFSGLIISLFSFALLLMVKIGNNRLSNNLRILKINETAKYTDFSIAEKTVYFNEKENFNKLNLNRADLQSIKNIPCLTAPMAKKIYEFIKNKGQVVEFSELLDITGMNKKKLKQLEDYATLLGGHAGSAAWGAKVNLNFTNQDELKSVIGLNKNIAQKIIDYRNENGGFRSIDDLYTIPGLNEKIINQFIEKVEVK